MKNTLMNKATQWGNKIVLGLRKVMHWWKPCQEKFILWWKPQQEKIFVHWGSLAPRERQALMGGSFVVILFLFYAGIWMPLNTQIDALHEKILQDKKTWLRIEAVDKQIKALENTQSTLTTKSPPLRINSLQEKIQQSSIGKNLTELRQISENAVRCSSIHIDFDQLMVWLIDFSQQQNFTIEQASIHRTGEPGMVQAEFVFRT